eukprot:Em0007g983a
MVAAKTFFFDTGPGCEKYYAFSTEKASDLYELVANINQGNLQDQAGNKKSNGMVPSSARPSMDNARKDAERKGTVKAGRREAHELSHEMDRPIIAQNHKKLNCDKAKSTHHKADVTVVDTRFSVKLTIAAPHRSKQASILSSISVFKLIPNTNEVPESFQFPMILILSLDQILKFKIDDCVFIKSIAIVYQEMDQFID